MLALAEILALVVLNALIHAAFTRRKATRRTTRAARPAKVLVSTHYPLHPSPMAHALRLDAAPEHAAHVRPAGLDW